MESQQILLHKILMTENLQTIFQPIFDISKNKVMGYEALTRGPDNHPLYSPAVIFDVADSLGLLSKLELLCRKLAIKQFAQLSLQGFLFINVSPYTIAQPNHPHGKTLDLVKEYNLSPKQIVIEVTERFEASDPNLLTESLEHYRSFGFKIAIDDLGTGYSGLRQWSEIKPDIVKIDRYFISGCQENIIKRELLRTIFELGRATGVEIIAEGIEESDEYIVLQNLGMKYAQGFLLAKPTARPNSNFPNELIFTHPKDDNTHTNQELDEFEISNLVESIPPIQANESCLAVYKTFKQSEKLHSLAVVNQNKVPIGIIYRDQLAELFSYDYGHALYDRKPIQHVMNQVPFTVDISASIDEVSRRVTESEQFDRRPEFIVTNKERYFGLANVRSLLKKMTEEKIKHAQHANPLTMLPGNIVIQQRLNHFIQHKQTFQMAYFDLDHFKPFNDLYGYAAGDSVIKLVAEILTEISEDNFIGHIGGDDFVVIFPKCNAKPLCTLMLRIFSERIINYLEPEHIQNDGYHALGRDGTKQFFPLLSVSCGVIKPDVEKMSTHHDISQLATIAKKQAKKMPNGKVYILEN